jgi:hypothetical protein
MADPRWDIYTPDFYLPLDDPTGWQPCPLCLQLPRVWVFDNGNYARCLCAKSRYGANQAEAPSIIEAMHKSGLSYDEYRTLLRDAWNSRCQAASVNDV